MKIQILQGLEGAQKAKGTAVVIDVFRAFSLECYLASYGAAKILPVGTVEQAFELQKQNPDYILVGERQGKILPGFDFGNSPSQIIAERIYNKTIVHTTSAGTQGIAAVSAGADEILTGSLVNAKAVAKYLLMKNPDMVSIVCMGKNGMEETPEDTLCGEYLKSLLEGYTIDLQRGLITIRNHKEGLKFFDPEMQDIFPQKDFEMCVDIDRFEMVLKVVSVCERIFETRVIAV